MSAEQSTVAVGYIRVASGSERKRERSVYLQRQAILAYAKLSNIQVIRFFSDHVCVTEIAARQGLTDTLGYIARGKASALIVSALGVLSDSVSELLSFVELNRFLAHGPGLIAVREQLDTRTAAGRLMLGAVQAVLNWDPSERTNGGLQ